LKVLPQLPNILQLLDDDTYNGVGGVCRHFSPKIRGHICKWQRDNENYVKIETKTKEEKQKGRKNLTREQRALRAAVGWMSAIQNPGVI